MNIANRFPILSFTSKLLRVIGFLVMIGAVIYGIATAVIEPMLPDHYFAPDDYMQALFALGGLAAGLLIVAFGECLGVLFAIEANTRATASAAKSTNSETQTIP